MKISDVSALGRPLLSQEVDGIICGNGLSGQERSHLAYYSDLLDSLREFLQPNRYGGMMSTIYQENPDVIPLLKTDVYKRPSLSGHRHNGTTSTENVVDDYTTTIGNQPKSHYCVTSMNRWITNDFKLVNGEFICGIDSTTV